MTRLGDDVVNQFAHGRKSSVGTSAVQLVSAATPASRGVLVKAAADNSGTVYVGNSSGVTADSADATDGMPIAAGEAVLVKINDASRVYLIGSASGQKVFWLVV